jgi:hypothetical protein
MQRAQVRLASSWNTPRARARRLVSEATSAWHGARGFSLAVMVAAVLAALALPQFGPPARAAGSGAVGGCRELIQDGGFESGGLGWDQHGVYEMVDPTWPHTGERGVWLGAGNNVSEWISQKVALPAGTSGITFQFWWSLMTEEQAGPPFDHMRAQLFQLDGTTLITTTVTLNDKSADDWQWNLSVADLSAYAGQTVELRFWAQTDATNPTNFFTDDVSMLACTESATPTATLTPTATTTLTLTPTPTLTPTFTPTPTHTDTPDPDASPTPTPTATRTPAWRLYLPLVVHSLKLAS